MNNHFISVGAYPGRKGHGGEVNLNTSTFLSNSIMLAPTTPTEVSNIINRLGNSVACGLDEFRPEPIK